MNRSNLSDSDLGPDQWHSGAPASSLRKRQPLSGCHEPGKMSSRRYDGCEILHQLKTVFYPSVYRASTCFNHPVGGAGFRNHPQYVRSRPNIPGMCSQFPISEMLSSAPKDFGYQQQVQRGSAWPALRGRH